MTDREKQIQEAAADIVAKFYPCSLMALVEMAHWADKNPFYHSSQLQATSGDMEKSLYDLRDIHKMQDMLTIAVEALESAQAKLLESRKLIDIQEVLDVIDNNREALAKIESMKEDKR